MGLGVSCVAFEGYVGHHFFYFFFYVFIRRNYHFHIVYEYMTLFASGYCTRMHSELQFICLLGLKMESFFSSVPDLSQTPQKWDLFALRTTKCSCKFVVMVRYSS